MFDSQASAAFMMQGNPMGMGGMPVMGSGPGEKGGGSAGQPNELQRARFRAQFSKTEICRYYRSGCRNGLACPWAHGDHEVEGRPDLTKTSLCRAWSKNACPLPKEECRFAHGAADLRVTPWYEKIALCQAFKHGRCKAGTACRFAHSAEELQPFGGGDKGGGKGSQPVPPMPWLSDPSSMMYGMPSGSDGAGGEPNYMMTGNMMPGPMMPTMMMPMQAMAPDGQMPLVMPQAVDPRVDEAKKVDVQLMVKLTSGGSVKFKIKAATPLRKLMDAFCTRKNLERSQVRFYVGDQEISADDTASKLGLSEDSVITAEASS